MKVPSQDAPVEELDQLYDEFVPLAKKVATEGCKEVLTYFDEKLEKAAKRAEDIKAIPNQARWFIKMRKGISDALKGKCLPRNKHTVEVINLCKRAVEQRRKKILEECVKFALLYPRKGSDSPYKIVYLKKFALGYNQYVSTFANFEKHLREQYKVAAFDEKTAIDLLNGYLKDKANMKDAPPDEYKQFKQLYEKVVKEMA